jgi:hypothetical protein
MDAYFGRHFRADAAQSERYYAKLSRDGDVLQDWSLRGPAEKYCVSELWCYIHYLWTRNHATNVLFSQMSDGRDAFDRRRALDVVLAANNQFAAPDDLRDGLDPAHLFAFIRVAPRV